MVTRRSITRRGGLGGAVALMLGLALDAAGARSALPAERLAEAEGAVQRLVEEIIELVSSDGLERSDAAERLGRVVDNEADLDRLGRMVLGQHWRAASEAEREEYQNLFRDLMLERFTGYLGAYSAGTDLRAKDDLFEITGSRRLGDQDVMVQSLIRPPTRPPLRVDWRLRNRDGRPVIIDVVVENVSLLISQRSEFASVIAQGGMERLLSEMRARLEEASS
jgi:phospholipid transport system substrate-binding protein